MSLLQSWRRGSAASAFIVGLPRRHLAVAWRTPTLLACSLALASPASALDPRRAITQYVHDTWYAKDGLPQNSVHAIHQTRDGYLWFGTEEG